MHREESISITIPALNEEKTIEKVCRDAVHAVSKITKNYEVLLVDDGSTDSTGKIMDKLKKEFRGKIYVIHHNKNKGFTGVMKTCYSNAKNNLIFLGPSDGQFDYSELKSFISAIRGNDFAVAYRVVNKERLIRKINSFFFHLLSRLLFGIKLKEFSSCIMYTKKVRDSIQITSNDSSCLFLPELIFKANRNKYKFAEVPIHFYKRQYGRANGSDIKIILYTLKEMVKFWFSTKFSQNF